MPFDANTAGIKAAEQMTTPVGTEQQIGAGIETLAEFMMGEGEQLRAFFQLFHVGQKFRQPLDA